MAPGSSEIEQAFWNSANLLRGRSRLSPHEYSVLVLGLILLRYMEHRFVHAGQQVGDQDASILTQQAPSTQFF